MAKGVIMPKAGMAMEEGIIIKWLKKEGDSVKVGEPLLVIETDKTSMEVEAEVSGVLLKIMKDEGEVVPVTEVIAYIGEAGEKVGTPEEAVKNSAKGKSTEEKISETMPETESYDVVVIGGGPAGYVAAIKAAQLGGKVALIEKDNVGGTCLNRGCIPTKTYLKNAEIIHNIKNANKRGIILENSTFIVDMHETVKVKNNVVKTLTSGIVSLLKSNGVKIYTGTGYIMKDKSVKVGEERLTARKIILAGGSKANKINIPGIESSLVLTSDDILDLKELPKELAIIGGGVIGVEMAMIFSAYGSKVTIIELMDRIVPGMDSEISKELTKSLTKLGVKIMTSQKLEKIEEKGDRLYLYLDGNQVVEAEKALLSIGRIPDIEGIGEIEFEMEKGKIKVNDKMETSVEGIYAPGDINGRMMLAHAAFNMGETAAINAMGGDTRADLRYVPSCIYTMPEVGSVGLTEEEAREKYDISIGKFPFAANGRALASGESAGFIKVIIDKKYGEILGVHIIGPGAAEIINEAAALMSAEITAYEAANIIHGHPTFSEAFMEACADSLGICVHLPKKDIV